MGASQSKPSKPSVNITESEKSARNVLERYAESIKQQAENDASGYKKELKGKLEEASFCGAYCEWIGVPKYGFSDPCYLHHMKNTNLLNNSVNERNPCHGRNQKRFDEKEGFLCEFNIRDYKKIDAGTACAPPRRRHMCDKNLEALTVANTKNSNDLLGNILVTAKYEGDSIVNSYANSGMFNVCTALARSFADIGDIIRGKDLFLGGPSQEKKKLEENLKKIFENIKKKKKGLSELSTEKVREYWWAIHRKEVWKAITCDTEESDTYFKQSSEGKYSFTNGQCGHNEENVLTNLDYVPQYLRWFDEWGEEFCRIRNHKLKRIKDACRNESKQLYCSHNGYDCRQMSWKKNIESREHYCTGCFSACSIYNMWVDKQKKEFEKQKEKYKNEIETYASNKDKTGSKINEEYYKEFYEKLKNEYKDVHNFLTLLNEGRYCKEELQGEENVDFTNTNEKGASYRSKYCKVCPYCGVDCVGTNCKPKKEIYPNCEIDEIYSPDGAETTEINVINSGDKEGYIFEKLEDFCINGIKSNGKNYEQWKCYYDNKKNNNKCKMEINIANSKLKNKITSFDFFFDLWIKNLLRDTINWKNDLMNCINNTNKTNCNKTCNENCKCFEKWLNKKEDEWNKITGLLKNKNGTSQNYYNKLKSHFDNYFFLVINNVNQGEEKWKKFTDELRNKIDSSKAKKGTNDAQDSIKLLLDHEKKNAGTCLQNNPSEPCSKAEPQKSDENTQPQDTPPNSCGASGTTASVEQMCKEVERYIKENNEKTERNTGCNKKGKGECMPPRRKSLCIYKLTRDTDTKTIDQLKMSFIKSAALETYLAWENYKGNNNEDYTQLQNGDIPEGFKRIMFYTFGDFRDLFFGTDMSNHHYINTLKEKVNKVLSEKIPSKNKESLSDIKYEWWGKNGEDIWKGMLCGLTYDIQNGKNDIIEKLHKKHNYPCDLEVFASKPQFLRWFTEWGDEFCRERKKKEEKVVADCSKAKAYEGCEKEKNGGNCADACKKYKEYIGKKKVEYIKQEGKFNREKTQTKPGYENYSSQEAPDYLKNECLNSACNCMDKVHTISDYWTNPHKTYDDDKLGIKCQCPPPPCTIVDDILGDKSSMGYREGCKTKYKTPRSQWECGKSSGESGKGGKEDGDVCIPPRRQKLYVYELETFNGKTQEDLRQAFIKCAAVETFFSWHEYKQEKKREEKEQNEQNLGYIYSVEKNIQNDLKSGKIPEDFKRQMFYTFGDYRDIFFGNDIGKDKDILNEKLNKVFANGVSQPSSGNNSSVQQRKKWWNKYAKDIWEGMLCALSYDTETKKKDEKMQKTFIGDDTHKKNIYKYDNVTFGDTSDMTLPKFASRPPFLRWFTEWGDEFCRKKNTEIDKIINECRARNGKKGCSGDGFDCNEIGPKEDETFVTFSCPSCAISCRSYKKWINTKKNEFNEQKSKYDKEIKDVQSKNYDNYDKEFVEMLRSKDVSVDSFLKMLKEGPCSNNNNVQSIINFTQPAETFKHAEYCDPCPVFGDKCKKGDCKDVSEVFCRKTKNKFPVAVKNKPGNIDVNMLVIDSTENRFAGSLNNFCNDTGIFKGIREDKWSCGYVCELDICKPNTSNKNINDEQNIPIRALFKRWVEIFLKDYNKINNKISPCINNEKKHICIDDCIKNCKCVEQWINLKKLEWKNIKERYQKQYNIDDENMKSLVRNFLEEGYFHSDINKAKEEFKELREFEYSSGCTDKVPSQNNECKKNDVIKVLLSSLEKKINDCKNERDEKTQANCKNLRTNDDTPTEDIPIYDKPSHMLYPPPFCNIPPNPCSGSGVTNVVTVKDMAREMQKEVHEGMLKRSGDKGESKLKADAKLGQYHQNGVGSDLKKGNKICDITEKHSNAKSSRGYQYDGPCTGKDNSHQMFKVENGWKSKHQINTPDDVFLPPRREHFCTSNLENLNTKSEGLTGSNASDSLLGDVLLSAKYEADYIKKKYNHKNTPNDFKDKATKCRAMKYSFADIGDIIKGTDLWDGNGGEKTTQDRLKEVFCTIHKSLKQEKEEKKYTKDGVYLDLRKDWWEANRAKVWEVMKCKTTNGEFPCSNKEPTPIDDYIPQRLRWMIEWAEWYCKIQKKEYEDLRKKCGDCKEMGGQCMNGTDKCNTCMTACAEYWKKIEPWKQQWEKIKEKYEELYKKEEKHDDATNTGTPDPKDEKDVVDFLRKLQQANKDNNTIYATAAGYIHQEAKYLDCKTQTQFCEKENGDNSTSAGKENEKYAFKKPPPEYQQACNCNENTPSAPQIPQEEKICADNGTVKCEKVGKEGKIKVPMDPKNGEDHLNEVGNEHNCGGIIVSTNGQWKSTHDLNYNKLDKLMYVSPRRQKFCVHELDKAKDEPDLKNKLLTVAANQGYNLAIKYDEYRKHYFVPPCHALKYSFYDYEHIILGDDPLELHSPTEKKLKHVFKESLENYSSDNNKLKKKRQDFWNHNKSCVWEAMKCGYNQGKTIGEQKAQGKGTKNDVNNIPDINGCTNNTPTEFDNVPQFLMWFTEWSEDFCYQRKEQLKKLEEGCINYKCGNSDERKKQECKNACEAYQKWLKDWKDQYEQQTAKFDKDKKAGKFDGTSAEEDVEYASSVHEYLQEQLQKLCKNNDCACMKKTSTKDEETELLGENYFPEAMDYPPQEIENKCDCAIPSEPMSCVEQIAKHLRKKAEKNVKIYESTLKGNGTNYNDTCNLIKKQNVNHGEANCDFKTRYSNGTEAFKDLCDNKKNERFKIGEKWDLVEDTTDVKNKLYIPPRRKHMCMKKLENMVSTDISDSNTLLEKIQYVAQNEGDDIIYKLLSKYPCNESVICDAMKYSFADLGDIIRGRTKIRLNNDYNIEGELQKIFKKIQFDNNSSLNNMELTELREKWWDANRKNVWKAMTCNVPNDALLKKRINKTGDTSKPMDSSNTYTQTQQTKKCGHNTEPPDYDYIPERYRFLQEWSEYYCKALKEKNDEMKNECPECLKTGNCQKDKNDSICKQCINKCEDYSKFVSEWKAHFEEQNDIYKKLYIHDRSYGPSSGRRNSYIKFIQKLEESCKNPHSAEEYLDKSTHCTDYKFSERNNNENYYAFSTYPKGYKDKCKCHENAPSDPSKILNFIKDNIFKSANIPGLNTIKKAVPRIPKRIKNIRPDAHTIHELVARTFPYFVPFFQTDDKTPPTHNILNDVLPSAIPVGIALALTSIAFLYLKKKPKSTVDLIRVLDIHKGDYGIPTPKSSNRYIPYVSDTYKGKTYIYMEGDSDEDKYAFMSDTTDVTSSESEYEEMDINDIYVPGSPKYKTLIEVVLEPSKSNGNTLSKGDPLGDDMLPTTNTFTDEEWNELKHDFISQYIQSRLPMDVPQYDVSTQLPMNIVGNVFGDKMDEKPFITSIHDRDLYSGEEISYNIHMSTNSMDDPKYVSNNVYSGIDLINDTLSGNQHIDIYDEVLKRKENELFGTNYKKNTSNNYVAKLTNSDPVMNQLDLLHKWLDRHRNMCEKWNTKEELLDKLNEQWNKDNNSGDIPNDNKMLNTDVSIEINMDDTKGKKEFSNMDTNVDTPTMDSILDDLETYNEPFYDIYEDDVYYDVNDDENPFVDDIPMDHNKVDVPKKVHVEMKILNNTSNGTLEPEFPISDVWNI
ncbi:erythrocyte membrane protein 1 [Plasmodium falciparum IGH-CR14]|uniref:Erythrocyte membrane protein 1 n=1 Tax=Plasmodium falciparum IGH-CR14 TaxID=580059 RepID=A0A0L1I6M7_PLAFA|nr:erythrocyte membrane protein 1 [Plasmodium falciparum IGH-CR14]